MKLKDVFGIAFGFMFFLTFGSWIYAALVWSDHYAMLGIVGLGGMMVTGLLWACFMQMDGGSF